MMLASRSLARNLFCRNAFVASSRPDVDAALAAMSPHVQSKEGDSKMPSNATQVLADFAASLKYGDIPDATREYCKDVLLDTLTCAIAGHQGEETHQLAALAAALARSDESTVI